jgi:signal peptidase I
MARMHPWEQREADRQLLELTTLQTVQSPSAYYPPSRVAREIVEMLLFVFFLFFMVRGVMQNFLIEGMSMEPTLHNDQFILVNKLAYFHFDLNAPARIVDPTVAPLPIYPFGIPQYGQVVVFEYPNDPSKDYIKRVIGRPGDEVSFRDGVVLVNGVQLYEPYLQGAPTYCQMMDVCVEKAIVVPEGTIFVMGDNRENSSDSREWGVLPLERVIGQAWVSYWPNDQIGVIAQYNPFGSPLQVP